MPHGSQYDIGDRIEVRRAATAVGNYETATIVEVRQVPYDPGSNWKRFESNWCFISVLRCFTCNSLPRPSYTYDVVYEDQVVENNIAEKSIRGRAASEDSPQ